MTVLPELRDELVAERDRLAGILGVAPSLAPLRNQARATDIKGAREFRLFLGAPREISHASASSFAVTRAKAAEQRELNLWLDSLVTSFARAKLRINQPTTTRHKRYPAPLPALSPMMHRGSHHRHQASNDLHLLPSESRFFPVR